MIEQRALEFIDYRRLAVDVIELLHRFYSYRDISIMTGIPPSMLSRYLRRRASPSKHLSLKIINLIINNNEVKYKISNLVRENPDILYENIVSNVLSFIIMSKHIDTLIEADAIIAFNDPSIALAMKLRDYLNKRLVVLYFAPIMPASYAEGFSILQTPVNILVCTRHITWRSRAKSALLVFPLIVDAKTSGIVLENMKNALKIKDIIPLIVLCTHEFRGNAICLFEQ